MSVIHSSYRWLARKLTPDMIESLSSAVLKQVSRHVLRKNDKRIEALKVEMEQRYAEQLSQMQNQFQQAISEQDSRVEQVLQKISNSKSDEALLPSADIHTYLDTKLREAVMSLVKNVMAEQFLIYTNRLAHIEKCLGIESVFTEDVTSDRLAHMLDVRLGQVEARLMSYIEGPFASRFEGTSSSARPAKKG